MLESFTAESFKLKILHHFWKNKQQQQQQKTNQNQTKTKPKKPTTTKENKHNDKTYFKSVLQELSLKKNVATAKRHKSGLMSKC